MLSFNIIALYVFLFINHALATDIIKTVTPSSGGGKSTAYKNEILLNTLKLTEPEYGAFIIKNTVIDMKPKRAINSMKTGELINVAFIAANEEWDKNTISIKTPIRGGTLSYRLLLVNKVELNKFANISTLVELNTLTAGLQNDWSTTKIFKRNGIEMSTSQNFEGLFLMLNSQRVDYIPRAIYEIYDELHMRKSTLENVVIEPTLALRVPMVSYAYVSPQEPRIANRLTLGLSKLTESGELKKIFNKYYAEDIKRANLKERKIIDIENLYFNKNPPLTSENFWKLH